MFLDKRCLRSGHANKGSSLPTHDVAMTIEMQNHEVCEEIDTEKMYWHGPIFKGKWKRFIHGRRLLNTLPGMQC